MLKIRTNDDVAAARVAGASPWRIIVSQGIPDALPAIPAIPESAKAMTHAARTIAGTALVLLSDADLRKDAHREFKEASQG